MNNIITGPNVYVSGMKHLVVQQLGPDNFIQGMISDSSVGQTGKENTATLTGSGISLTQEGDGKPSYNWSHVVGDDFFLTAQGNTTVNVDGRWATIDVNGVSNVTARGDGLSLISHGTLTGNVDGKYSYVKSYGPTRLTISGDVGDAFLDGYKDGVPGKTEVNLGTTQGEWIYSNSGAGDVFRLNAGAGATGTRVWLDGQGGPNKAEFVLLDGSKTRIDVGSGVGRVNLLVGDDASYQVTAGSGTKVSVVSIEDLFAKIDMGYEFGVVGYGLHDEGVPPVLGVVNNEIVGSSSLLDVAPFASQAVVTGDSSGKLF